jgi:hypothetical protein
MSRLKKLSGEAVDLSASLGSSIKERVQQIDDIPSIDQVSDRVFGDKQDDLKPVNLVGSTKLEEYKRVLAWIVDTNSSALIDLTNAILPFMYSHITIHGDSVRISEEGGPAVLESLLYNLNYLSIMGRDTITDFGIVPKSINISEESLDLISEKWESFVSAFVNTREAAKTIQDASNPLLDYSNELAKLSREEDVTDVKKLRKYERTMNKFRNNLEKIDFSQYNQVDFQKYLDAADGKHIVSSLDVDASYGEFRYNFSYYIHEGLNADPERYVAPFFHCFDNLDQQYYETLTLFEECDNKSGFLRGPPHELKEKALNSLNDFNTSCLAAASSYYITMSSYYDSDRADGRKNDIRKQLKRKGKHRKLVKDIYEIIYSANLVQPVSRMISPY